MNNEIQHLNAVIKEHFSAISELEELVSVIEQKMDYVLRPLYPEAENDAQKLADNKCSPAITEVKAATSRVQGVISQLSGMLNRIQL